MERLTYRDEKGAAVKEQAENKTEDVWNCIERLCELEDMMEDGRLVELPRIDTNFQKDFSVLFFMVDERINFEFFTGKDSVRKAAARREELEGG